MEVDLIPFGQIENERREIFLTKPGAFTLHMPGFLEAFPFIETIESGGHTLKACPLEGIVMLKLISNNDRPGRTHDLVDIDNIIDNYFDWNADEIFNEHHGLFDVYDVDDLAYQSMIAAHVTGRKINRILLESQTLKSRIIDYYLLMPTPVECNIECIKRY